MKNSGPYIHNYLTTKTFDLFFVLALALINIALLISLLIANEMTNVIRIITNILIVFVINYLLVVGYDYLINKVRNTEPWKRSMTPKLIINSLVFSLMLNLGFGIPIIITAVIIAFIVVKLVDLFYENDALNSATLGLLIVYVLGLFTHSASFELQYVVASPFINILLLIALGLFSIIKLIKWRLLLIYMITFTILLFGLYLLSYDPRLIAHTLPLMFMLTFILLNNQTTPTTKRGMLVVGMMMTIIGIISILILEEYSIVAILLVINLANLFNRKIDLLLLRNPKK